MKLSGIILLLFFAGQVQATNIFFANSGSDGGAGTFASPYATLSKFNTLSLTAGDSVFFKRGDTFTGQITSIGSGASGNRIFIGAYGSGAKPVFTGFTTLTSWSNLGSNIWEAPVNSGLNLNLVTLNDVVIMQGRTPNFGTFFHTKSGTVSFPTGWIKGSLSEVNASVKNWTGAEIVLNSTVFSRDRNFITSHTDSTIYFNSQSSHSAGADMGFFFQHDPSTLNVQNEWYYNSNAHTIQMYSTVNPSTLGTVKAAVYDAFIDKDPINHIEFNNLKFTGYDSNAMRFRYGVKMKVNSCDFDLIGCDAIFTDTDLRDSVVYSNFTNIQNTAIAITYTEYAVVMYNDINHCGLNEGTALGNNQQMDGILLANSGDSCVVKYNVVKNVGYCGITFDGNNAVIRKNVVDSFGLQLSDGGGIYTCCNNVINTPSIGLRQVDSNIVTNGYGYMKGNLIPAIGGHPGIYIDDNAGQINITENTVINSTRYGAFFHNTNNIIFTRNTIYQNNGTTAIGLEDDDLGAEVRDMTITDNQAYVPFFMNLISLRSDVNDYHQMGYFNNNYYLRSASGNMFATTGSVGASYTMAGWKSTFGYDLASNLLQVADDSMRIEYAEDESVVRTLPATHIDVKNVGYAGALAINPWRSFMLIKRAFPKFRTPKTVKKTSY